MRYRTTRTLLVMLSAFVTLGVWTFFFAPLLTSAAPLAAGTGYVVGPSGSDSNDGRSTSSPFKTIQKGFDMAQPGDTITLMAGSYAQDAISRRNGTASAPITLTGPANAIVKGGGNARILEINHDYVVLDGFTIDGQNGSTYRDKLLYVHGIEAKNGVTGLRVRNMTLKNGGGECFRLRYFVQQSEISNNAIGPCGRDDFPNGVWGGSGKNGEGIYVGTAPEQRADGKNPTSDPDLSTDNWIHNNTFNTQGNECVDIKEAASRNIVEYNDCTGQKDPESGGFDARGSGNTFRYNTTYGNLGAGIRLGGDTSSDGTNTDIYGNTIRDNKQGGIKFQVGSQGKVCGNTMNGNAGGDSVGSYAGSFAPASACSGTLPTSAPTQAATKTPIATQVPTQAATKTTQPPASTATKTATPASPTKTPGVTKTPSTTNTPSPTQVTQPPSTGTTFIATEDTFINSDSSGSSYGSKDYFKSDQTPENWALLRFQLPAGPIRKATLKLYVENGSDKGGRVVLATGNWNESTTWKTRPSIGVTIGEIGKASTDKFVTIDVTQAAQNGGTISLAIIPTSIDAVNYTSSEGNTSDAPQLIIEN